MQAVMEKAVDQGYILATDLADYLVKKGEPFRSAHGIVARLVNHAISQNKNFSRLSLDELKKFSPLFGEDVRNISLQSSLSARNVHGGTAPRQVAVALRRARKLLDMGK